MFVNYATVFDARNIHLWSGLGYYMGKMLEEQGHDVEYLNNLQISNKLVHKFVKHFMRKILSKTYSPNFSISVAKEYSTLIQKNLPPGSLIFSPNSIILSHLPAHYKKVLYTDATFERLLNFYPAFTNIPSNLIKQAHFIERQALQQCDLLIYSSQWAADSAINYYGVDPSKIAIVPFGANIDLKVTGSDIPAIINNRVQKKEVHLLLIAVAWYRKGGDYAIEVVKKLNEMGIEAKLHIVGIRKLPPDLDMTYVIDHGYISKASTEGQKYIVKLLKEVDFLLLPSRADCTPVAVSEANSFGLPCLLSNVGGNHSIIETDKNGSLFDFTKGPEECCDYIKSYISVPEKYRALCFSSYDKYSAELNWQASGKKISQLLFSLAGVRQTIYKPSSAR